MHTPLRNGTIPVTYIPAIGYFLVGIVSVSSHVFLSAMKYLLLSTCFLLCFTSQYAAEGQWEIAAPMSRPSAVVIMNDLFVVGGSEGTVVLDSMASIRNRNTTLRMQYLRSLELHRDTLWAGGSSGLYFSTDTASTWQAAVEGINVVVMYSTPGGLLVYCANSHNHFSTFLVQGHTFVDLRHISTFPAIWSETVVVDHDNTLYTVKNGKIVSRTIADTTWTIAARFDISDAVSIGLDDKTWYLSTQRAILRSRPNGFWDTLYGSPLGTIRVRPNVIRAGSSLFDRQGYPLPHSLWGRGDASPMMTINLSDSLGLEIVDRRGKRSFGWIEPTIAYESIQDILIDGMLYCTDALTIARTGNHGRSWLCTDRQHPWPRSNIVAIPQGILTVRADTIFAWKNDRATMYPLDDSPRCQVLAQDRQRILAFANNGDIHESTDSGASWHPAGHFPSDRYPVPYNAVIHGDTILLIACNGGAGYGIHRSVNRGASWQITTCDEWMKITTFDGIVFQHSNRVASLDWGDTWIPTWNLDSVDSALEPYKRLIHVNNNTAASFDSTDRKRHFIALNGQSRTWHPIPITVGNIYPHTFALTDSALIFFQYSGMQANIELAYRTPFDRRLVTSVIEHSSTRPRFNLSISNCLLTIRPQADCLLDGITVTIVDMTGSTQSIPQVSSSLYATTYDVGSLAHGAYIVVIVDGTSRETSLIYTQP